MSGGSFDYLYCQDANRLLVSDQLRAMQETLAGMHPQSQAAIRTSALLSRCTEFLEYLEAEQQALAGVWHAVEWRVSGDYGDDQVAAAVAKLEPMLKLPIEWATERGYVIGDPDGWRGSDGRPLNDPIGQEEFQRRFGSSTVAPLSSLSGQVQFDGELRRSTLDPERAAALLAKAREYRPQYDAEVAAANGQQG